jgi:hypothetical protein
MHTTEDTIVAQEFASSPPRLPPYIDPPYIDPIRISPFPISMAAMLSLPFCFFSIMANIVFILHASFRALAIVPEETVPL